MNTNRQVQRVGEVLQGFALLYNVLLFLYCSHAQKKICPDCEVDKNISIAVKNTHILYN